MQQRRHLLFAGVVMLLMSSHVNVTAQALPPELISRRPFATAPLAAAVVASPPAQPRPAALTGDAYVGVSNFDPSRQDPVEPALGAYLHGPIGAQTQLRFSLAHGPADLLWLLALTARQGTTMRLEVVHPQWQIHGGDFIAPAHALTGQSIRADGIKIHLTKRVVADVMVGRPKFFGGSSGGYMAHASVGVRHRAGTLRLLATDVSQPAAAGARVTVVSTPAVESERDVEDLQRISALLPTDRRFRAVGGELHLRRGTAHEFLARAGWIAVDGGVGTAGRGGVAELRYTLLHPRGTLGAYARRSPPNIAGTHFAGDAATVNGTVRLAGPFTAVGHVYGSSSPLLRLEQPVVAAGAVAGIQYSRGQTRITLRGKSNLMRAGNAVRSARTINLNLAVPLPSATVSADLETGLALQNGVERPYRAATGRLGLFDDRPVSLGISGRYDDVGTAQPRFRADADVTAAAGGWLLEAGGGYGSGQLLGALRHGWANFEMPMPRRVTLVLGVDHVRWDHTSSPYLRFADSLRLDSPWRLTLGVRRSLSVPVDLFRVSRESRGPMPWRMR